VVDGSSLDPAGAPVEGASAAGFGRGPEACAAVAMRGHLGDCEIVQRAADAAPPRVRVDEQHPEVGDARHGSPDQRWLSNGRKVTTPRTLPSSSATAAQICGDACRSRRSSMSSAGGRQSGGARGPSRATRRGARAPRTLLACRPTDHREHQPDRLPGAQAPLAHEGLPGSEVERERDGMARPLDVSVPALRQSFHDLC
jgi:hypothetical protein